MQINSNDTYDYLNKSTCAKILDGASYPLRRALGGRVVDLRQNPPALGSKAYMIARLILGLIAAIGFLVTVPAYFLRKGLITKGSEAAKIQPLMANVGGAAQPPPPVARPAPAARPAPVQAQPPVARPAPTPAARPVSVQAQPPVARPTPAPAPAQVQAPAPAPRPAPVARPAPTPAARPARVLNAQSPFLDIRRIQGLQQKDFHNSFPKVSQSVKYGIRNQTARDVFNNPYGLEPLKGQVRLYEGQKSSKPDNLLNRFDVVQVPCEMQYGYDWKPLAGEQKTFFIHHAAAINIGESSRSEDFAEYSRNGKLDEERYVRDMGTIFHNVLEAQKRSGVKDAVWFPFGMGAFLRHLGKMDPSYDQERIFQLRLRITEEFVRQAEGFPELTLHMCLPFGAVGDEATQNYNAFISAFQNGPAGLKERTHFYLNCDASKVAQELANKNGENSVSLVNGANRKLLGNHWFADGAMVAIDENLHRRSPMLAKVSYWLNNGKDVRGRQPKELAIRISQGGGRVETL